MTMDNIVTRLKQIAKRILTDSVVQIEPTRRCNFNCQHCNHKDSDGYLDLDTYKAILKKHADCRVVKLQGLGEPLLHPRIQDLIEIAKGNGHKVMIFTNGSCGYVSNVDYYVFSLETMSPKKYASLGKHNLPKVIENIRNVAARQKIFINCVQCSNTSPADVTEVKKFAREIEANLMLTPQEVWFDSQHPEYTTQVEQARLAWRIHGVDPRHKKYRVCNWGLSEFYYDYTGASHPCCIRMTDEYRNAKPSREICRSCPL